MKRIDTAERGKRAMSQNPRRVTTALRASLRASLTMVLALTVGLIGLSALGSRTAQGAVTPEEGEAITFYHHDALGNAALATDEAGRVLWYENTDPYGRSRGRQAPSGQQLAADPFGENTEEGRARVGYTGHVRDGATGLTYMQARHYAAEYGRFLSNDPVGFVASQPMSFNRYGYANNNPYAFVDPDGRYADTVIDVAFGLYDTGRVIGAAAAWGVGKITGNHALSDVAGEGLASAASDLGTDIAMAAAPGLNAGMVRGAKAAADAVPDGPISMDEALGRAAGFMKEGVPVKSVDGKTGVQFIQEFTENGDRITRRAGIDVNPNSRHVQQHGPHLNLQTQVNGKIQRSGSSKDPHTPIDSDTVKDGDY